METVYHMTHLQAKPSLIAPTCSTKAPCFESPCDWLDQAKPSLIALTCSTKAPCFESPFDWLDRATPLKLNEDVVFRAPPGLEPPEPEPASLWKTGGAKAKKQPLSLAALCAHPVDTTSIDPPPGLDLWGLSGLEKTEFLWAPPDRLVPTPEKGAESDTTVGSAGGWRTSEADDSCPSDPEFCPGLVLAEVSQLKATSPMFHPLLSQSDAALLLNDAIAPQRTPLRTKLRSKAQGFVPSAGVDCFVPTATANESWQTSWQNESCSNEWCSKESWQTSCYENGAGYYSDQGI